MTDKAKYALPLGWLGTIFHPILVISKLDKIFQFREKTIAAFFLQTKQGITINRLLLT